MDTDPDGTDPRFKATNADLVVMSMAVVCWFLLVSVRKEEELSMGVNGLRHPSSTLLRDSSWNTSGPIRTPCWNQWTNQDIFLVSVHQSGPSLESIYQSGHFFGIFEPIRTLIGICSRLEIFDRPKEVMVDSTVTRDIGSFFNNSIQSTKDDISGIKYLVVFGQQLAH
jgi:hypothetical protein